MLTRAKPGDVLLVAENISKSITDRQLFGESAGKTRQPLAGCIQEEGGGKRGGAVLWGGLCFKLAVSD